MRTCVEKETGGDVRSRMQHGRADADASRIRMRIRTRIQMHGHTVFFVIANAYGEQPADEVAGGAAEVPLEPRKSARQGLLSSGSRRASSMAIGRGAWRAPGSCDAVRRRGGCQIRPGAVRSRARARAWATGRSRDERRAMGHDEESNWSNCID